VQFEERASSIYLILARQFEANSELSWFWVEMSMEERQHAVLLDFCGCHRLVGENLPDQHAIEALSEFLSQLEARATQQDLSVDDAFLIAAELEASEINAIYDRTVRPIQGTWYLAKKKTETFGVNHAQVIATAARKFGVADATLARLAELER
jgi:hypothetical protein